jgi:hypothetical protein
MKEDKKQKDDNVDIPKVSFVSLAVIYGNEDISVSLACNLLYH